MSFTIAEDIDTLLTANYDLTNQYNVKNGDFEKGDLSSWALSGTATVPEISTAQKHGGTYSCKYTANGQTITQESLNIEVDLLTAGTCWRYFATAGGGASNTWGIVFTYTDDTSTTILQDADNLDSWVEIDFLASLTAGKTIKKIAASTVTTTEAYFDDLVFALPAIQPNIRLQDDDPPSAYPDEGEIIIKDEQLLRTDPFNGLRTETFLVDIDLIYEAVSATAPTILKAMISEFDRVIDAESIATTTYFYKLRYNWLSSYRIGVVRLQVEVMNALVVRPGSL